MYMHVYMCIICNISNVYMHHVHVMILAGVDEWVLMTECTEHGCWVTSLEYCMLTGINNHETLLYYQPTLCNFVTIPMLYVTYIILQCTWQAWYLSDVITAVIRPETCLVTVASFYPIANLTSIKLNFCTA